MELTSQKMRKLAPELDPLRLGTGWTPDELSKPQIIVESTFGDSHPGSGHLDKLVNAACKGAAEAGGHGARYFATDICDGESQGTDGINFSLASREMIANMIEIHANATPFDGGVYISSCDKGMPANLMGLARVNIPSVVVTGGTMHAGPELLTLEQLGMYSAKYERGEIDSRCLRRRYRRWRRSRWTHWSCAQSERSFARKPVCRGAPAGSSCRVSVVLSSSKKDAPSCIFRRF